MYEIPARCELCELAPTTRWYAQYFHPLRFTILDCDSCDVPMAVLGEHRIGPSEEERAIMQRALTVVASEIGMGEIFFDDNMRQIPDHYHVHARPMRWGWRRP